MFPKDWMARLRRQGGLAPAPQEGWRESTQALAQDVQTLCVLCESLLSVIAEAKALPDADGTLGAAPRQLDAIRRTAGHIASESRRLERHWTPADEDPYSLAALHRLMHAG